MKVKILATKNESKKFHPYQVETKGKHPIHIIEGGEYLTEDMRIFDECDDCGVWWLNQREFDYFMRNLKVIEIEMK